MNSSIVVMDGSLRRSDSLASTSEFVQINSIAIDISSSTIAIDPPKHDHFTLRGYAKGMRTKDVKKCSPFASEGNDVDVVDNLPPLFVPRFRWWQCSDCISDIETTRTTEEMVVTAQTDSCHNVGDKNSLHSRENTGNELHLRVNAVGEDNDQSKHIKKSKLCRIERRKASTCNKPTKTDIKDKEAGNQANPLQIIERFNNATDASDMVHVGESSLCVVDEPDNASSGSDGNFIALPQKRKPKLRSLADIMVTEKNPTSENPRTRSTSSSGMQVTSTETETVLVSQPVLDVTTDVGKAARSPERKRKIYLEEDGGPSGMVYGPSAKRIKEPVLHGGKNCRRMEVSDSESERDASLRLTQRMKLKKNKAVDIVKKTRHREDGCPPMRKFPTITATTCGNLQKYNNVSQETSFGMFVCAPPRMGELEPGLSSFQSGQQLKNVSSHSNNKTGEVGANHDALMPPRKSNLGVCNMRENVALDLSLNSFVDAERNFNYQASARQNRGIPDLNEESPEKTELAQGQPVTIFSQERISPLHKTLDVSASCSNETAREGNRRLGTSGPRNIEHGKELGASDDIPMEIVELLAKNRRERALENSRRHFLGINNSTYSPLRFDGRPGMIDITLNRSNGLTTVNGNLGIRQNFPPNFPQLNKEDSQFRLFGSSAPSQQRRPQFAASSSTMAGQRCSTGPDLLWAPTRENSPGYLSIAPKHSIQPSYRHPHSFTDRCHKGKTISDVKDGKEKRAVHNASVSKEQRMGPISTSMGSLDPYSNDTIPAMQLLSLMDQRVVSGSSFEVGTKGFLDKSFSPCNHHPRLNGKENQNLFSGSFFSQNGQSEGFPGLRYGAYCSGESSKKASSNLRVETPHEFGKPNVGVVEGSRNLTIQPVRNDPALGVCTLNRNPADFSIPDSRNEFTLCAKDLKFRKRKASKEKSRMGKGEGRKKPRMGKDAVGKEYSRK